MKNSNLAFKILEALENHYLNANDLGQKLRMSKIDFDEKIFYPTLSQLQLKNLLCYNWISNNNGHPVKYYHLTRNGLKYLHQ